MLQHQSKGQKINQHQLISVSGIPIFCHSVYILYIQDVSQLEDITAAGDFLGLSDQKSSFKHVSDFGRLRSYGHFLIPVHALV